jgi:hypothetical protein
MTNLPDPNIEQVALWLQNDLGRDTLHQAGWQEVNKRFHGIARAARPYIQEHFTTPEEQKAAFDGLTLALLTMGHFDDINALQHLLTEVTSSKNT